MPETLFYEQRSGELVGRVLCAQHRSAVDEEGMIPFALIRKEDVEWLREERGVYGEGPCEYEGCEA